MASVRDFRQVINGLIPTMVEIMRRAMELTILRELLRREPTSWELWFFDDQLYRRELARWAEDRLTAPEKIHRLVWG